MIAVPIQVSETFLPRAVLANHAISVKGTMATSFLADQREQSVYDSGVTRSYTIAISLE